MPQLDINLFIPIVYWTVVTFYVCFFIFYIFLIVPFINEQKLRKVYRRFIAMKVNRILLICRSYSNPSIILRRK